jgi:hypothetical protein
VPSWLSGVDMAGARDDFWGCHHIDLFCLAAKYSHVVADVDRLLRIMQDDSDTTCRCFLHWQITGCLRSHDSSSKVVSRTTSTQEIYPSSGPSLEVIALCTTR